MSSNTQPDRLSHLPERSPASSGPAETPARLEPLRARGWWAETRGYQRLAYLVGAALIVIGLAHAGLWALTGGSASGALSWRKPTTFGFSFGLITVTLAWVGGYLPVRPAVGWVAAGLLGAAVGYEVVVQHARGVPAHFNDTTPLDERLFIAGAVMVAVAIVVIAAMTLAAFVRTTAPAPLAVAIRAGLVGLLAAQASGVWMLLHGLALLEDDADPLVQSMSTVGAAGQLKFAHAVPMHALQVLVVLAWLLWWSGLPQRRQTQLVALGVVGYGAWSGWRWGAPPPGWPRLGGWTPGPSATCWRRCYWLPCGHCRGRPPSPRSFPQGVPPCGSG
jgi:hypothetical protein